MANNTMTWVPEVSARSCSEISASGSEASWNITSDEALAKTVKYTWKGYQVRDTIVGILTAASSQEEKDNDIIMLYSYK